MLHPLLDLRLQTGPLLPIVFFLSIVALLVLGARRPLRRWVPIQLIGAVVGAIVGLILAWLVSDVWNTFGVSLTPVTRMWFALGVGGVGFALAGLWRARVWRIVIGAASAVLFAFAGALGVNVDVAEFPTLGSALGVSTITKLELPPTPTTTLPIPTPSATSIESLAQSWQPPADLPKSGTVGSVTIPATVSHFAARSALVYLPPAALVANAPRLPVLVMLSGQPGSPANVITSGSLATILDQFARAHSGLAPIVVIPDQLGASQANPMCVDSPLGNSATYLTVDVPKWINQHLHVMTDRTAWAIGGFSQGGTCAIQLGAKYRALFGSIFDISGQLAPFRTSIPYTIATAFAGSQAAYTAATPTGLLAAGAPYADTLGLFFVGQNDARYSAIGLTVSNAARAAGMKVHFQLSPGTAHDWHTVQFAFHEGLPVLAARWGLL